MPFRVGFYVRQQGFLISSTFLREATGVSIVCTFSKIGIIKIGTIKLPQRQINGSSYKE